VFLRLQLRAEHFHLRANTSHSAASNMATTDQPMEDVQVHEHDRSPSPAPPPPVATAPGPRATALQKLYADAIAHVLKTCSYNNFASCFPTPANEVPGSIKHLHEQFNDRLGSNMRTNFEDILTERNVVPSLNELDALIEDAKKRKAKAEEEANGQPIQAPIP
jgi:kinetochore protein NNF1